MTATISHIRPWHPEPEFSDRLRIVRRSHGRNLGRRKTLTCKEFAAMIDVPAGTYGLWESGASKHADVVDIAKRIQGVTGCEPAWLLGFGIEPTGPDSPSTQEKPSSGWVTADSPVRLHVISDAA